SAPPSPFLAPLKPAFTSSSATNPTQPTPLPSPSRFNASAPPRPPPPLPQHKPLIHPRLQNTRLRQLRPPPPRPLPSQTTSPTKVSRPPIPTPSPRLR